jgi:predicted heme/steroid binding protein
MKALFISFIIVMALSLSACSPKGSEENHDKGVEESLGVNRPATEQQPLSETSSGIQITLSELSSFNGKNGNPAYIAVDGIVYDVTKHPAWAGGDHRGRFEPGKDYSVEMRTIPRHGTSKLGDVPAVGTLID